MAKRALLIGINYINTPNRLEGCIYDVIEMKSLIVDAYGFDPNTIVVLRDDDPANMPTRGRILQELQAFVANATPATQLFLHYSGHGVQITDTTGIEEIDNKDECIVPCDYLSAGVIIDDQINSIVKGVRGLGLAIFDCCRSGTIMDLPYTGITTGNQSEGFYCFSGCQDNQDAFEEVTNTQGSNTGLPQGAMTMAFISTIRSLNYYPTISNLYSAILSNLQTNGYSQTPQLTSTVAISSRTPFPFDSPNEQLAEQLALNQLFQAQIQQLQAQVSQLAPQASLVPTLQTQVQTLSVIQEELTTLKVIDASNGALITSLQEQVATIPDLQAQADLVPMLQTQVSLMPPLQEQIVGLMNVLGTQAQLQNRILELENQVVVLEAELETLRDIRDDNEA
jgi:hypothetical protein